MTDLEARKQSLVARLGELNARMQKIDGELEHHNNPDLEDQAIELETNEVLEDLGLSAQQEARAIEFALKRIEDGEYGTCQKCGEEISEERLDVLPFTPFCKDCAAKAG